MDYGRKNIWTGFLFLAGFMAFGFLLIYLRDFAPGRAEWIANYAVGRHFEARLAHAHGNLFALINVAVGLVLSGGRVSAAAARSISWLALVGMLMPVGILGELTLGLPPALVLLGGASMTVVMAWLGVAVLRGGRVRGGTGATG